MNIYRLESLKDEFGMLELDAPRIAEVFGDLGFDDIREAEESIIEEWPVSHGGFYSLNNTEEEHDHTPNVYLWNNSMLALSTKAKTMLEPNLKAFGEFLPFNYRDNEYYIFTTFSIVEPDAEKSEELYEHGDYMGD